MSVATTRRRTRRHAEHAELRPGFRLPAGVKVQAVADAVEAVKEDHGGAASAVQVKEAARPRESPLHPAVFDCPKAEAAERYYTDRAGYVCRCYYVVVEDDDEQTTQIANVSVRIADEDGEPGADRCYVSSARILTDQEIRDQVVDEAERLLRGVVDRWRHLPTLRDLIAEAVRRLELD